MTELNPGPDEPAAKSFVAMNFASWLQNLGHLPANRPRLIAIDGRGGSGKSSLASRCAAELHGAPVIHTDDIAWNYSAFGWAELLKQYVLEPLRCGQAVDYRPPGWASHGRPGAIHLPRGCTTVLVEGTGTIHRELEDVVDATVWIQAEFATIRKRAIDRDVSSGVNGGPRAAEAFWEHWQSEEIPFPAERRPRAKATTIVAGTPVLKISPQEIAVAAMPEV